MERQNEQKSNYELLCFWNTLEPMTTYYLCDKYENMLFLRNMKFLLEFSLLQYLTKHIQY